MIGADDRRYLITVELRATKHYEKNEKSFYRISPNVQFSIIGF